MDRNNSGSLSPSEFMQVFTSIGAKISPVQMKKLFQHIDDDNSGDITLVELRRHIRKRRKIAEQNGMSKLAERVVMEGGTKFKTVHFTDFEHWAPIEAANLVLIQIQKAVRTNPKLNLKAVFRSFDLDGGGSIDKEEFNNVLLAFHIQLSTKEVDNVFAIFDPEGDGDISYLEFVYAVKNRADFIFRLLKAEKKRIVAERINSLRHWDDPLKVLGGVAVDREDMDEEAMEWMKRTSEHTDWNTGRGAVA
jgi:Ca2+-binding EF-hand superfamily protein